MIDITKEPYANFLGSMKIAMERRGAFYSEITLPYQEMLDLKNIVMNAYGSEEYDFVLVDKSERGDKELTIGFRVEKVIRR